LGKWGQAVNSFSQDFFKAFLGTKSLWVHYAMSWIILIPFFLLCKAAIIEYDEMAIATLGCYGLLIIAVMMWLKKRHPERSAQWEKAHNVHNMSRPELLGYVAFTIMVTGMLGWGLMMAVFFAQLENQHFLLPHIGIFLIGGLLFGLLVALPKLALGLFPKHKKVISVLFCAVVVVFLFLSWLEVF
jgi:hypothetical protein